MEALKALKSLRSPLGAALEAIQVHIRGAFTAADLEPLIRGVVHRWANREGLAVLDNEIHRLSESIAVELLERYPFPRVDPFDGVPHQRKPRVPGARG